ncbi:DUF664 domain-containing protein [Streptomyces sp. NK08204]|uniref:mycothiol transferase n=1 Tax=Streptomyces sp. NK08204 TaxID=2873260 RepID=UPI0035A86457
MAGVPTCSPEASTTTPTSWDQPSARCSSRAPRRVLIDVIEEYARHPGHADLIREAVDGPVGEDPPQTNANNP